MDIFSRIFHATTRRTMIRTACTVLVASLLVGGCEAGDEPREAPSVQTPSEDALDVEQFLIGYYDAFSNRNWKRFADRFHDGAHIAFVMPDSTGRVDGVTFQDIPDFVALAPLGPGSREIFEERMTGHTIHVSGDLASAWVQYEARFGDPGEVMEWTGTDAITMIRIDDRWRITSLTYVPEL